MHIKVRVNAGAKRERIERKGEDFFIIDVREPAERNMANQRVRAIVANELGVSMGAVRILVGHTSPAKILQVASE